MKALILRMRSVKTGDRVWRAISVCTNFFNLTFIRVLLTEDPAETYKSVLILIWKFISSVAVFVLRLITKLFELGLSAYLLFICLLLVVTSVFESVVLVKLFACIYAAGPAITYVFNLTPIKYILQTRGLGVFDTIWVVLFVQDFFYDFVWKIIGLKCSLVELLCRLDRALSGAALHKPSLTIVVATYIYICIFLIAILRLLAVPFAAMCALTVLPTLLFLTVLRDLAVRVPTSLWHILTCRRALAVIAGLITLFIIKAADVLESTRSNWRARTVAAVLKKLPVHTVLYSVCTYYVFFYWWARFFTSAGVLIHGSMFGNLYGFTDGDASKTKPAVQPWIRVQHWVTESTNPMTWEDHYIFMMKFRDLVFGGVDRWSDCLYFNVEGALLVFLVLVLVASLVLSVRRAEWLCVEFVRIPLVFLALSKFAVLLSGNQNILCNEFMFVHMYSEGWFEAVFVALILVISIYAFALNRVRCERFAVYSAAYLALSYGAVTVIKSADLTTLFLTVELLSISSVLVVSSLSAVRNTTLYRYVLFNAVCTVALAVGALVLFISFGAVDLVNLSSFFKHTKSNLHLPLILAVVIKLISAPFLIAGTAVYTRLGVAGSTAFINLLKAAYISLIVKFTVCVFGIEVTSGFFLTISVVCTVSIVVFGVGAVRAKGVIAGLMYSSLQHVAFLLLGLCTTYGTNFTAVVVITYFMFYVLCTVTVLSCLALTERIHNKGSAKWAVFVAIGCAGVLSLAGIPPFYGFVAKTFLVAALVDSGMPLFGLVVVFGSIAGFIFYNRILLVLTAPTTDSLRPDCVRHAMYCHNSAVLAYWAVFIAFSVVAVLVADRGAAGISWLVDRVLAPVLRNTEHRVSIVTSGFGVLYALAPNRLFFYSLGNILWGFLTRSSNAFRYGDIRGMETLFTDPYIPPLLPQKDSRSFWINEWLTYPWQSVPGLRGSIEPELQELYRARGGAMRGFLYRWNMYRYATLGSTHSWWPFRAFLRVYDPTAYVDGGTSGIKLRTKQGLWYDTKYGTDADFETSQIIGRLETMPF